MEIVIVATGTANTASVKAALIRAGATSVVLTTDPAVVAAAPRVVLPGVGSYGAAWAAIEAVEGLAEALRLRVKEGRSTLFVCVGMQLLCEASEESPGVRGIGAVAATVTRFPTTVRTPQHGWNAVSLLPSASSGVLTEGSAFFSNSYCLRVAPLGWRAAVATHGVPFIAAMESANGRLLACQCHPELSGAWGHALLCKWVALTPLAARSTGAVAAEHAAALQTASTVVRRRVIPCLDVANGRVVKGVKFADMRDAGDPAAQAMAYAEQGADELVMLDVSATLEGRSAAIATVQAIRAQCSLPLTVGGGIRDCASAHAMLAAGADKVSVNTAAVADPTVLTRLATRFGRQCVVLAIDAQQWPEASGKTGWQVVTHSGKKRTGKDVVEWAKEGVALGAGEILLTSFDRDGCRGGYDCAMLTAVSSAVATPVIASGGCDSPQHMVDALAAGADAVLAASIFHYGDYTVRQVKHEVLRLSKGAYAVDVRGASLPEKLTTPGGDYVTAFDSKQCIVASVAGGSGTDAAAVAQHGILGEVSLRLAADVDVDSDAVASYLKAASCRVAVAGGASEDAALALLHNGASKVVVAPTVVLNSKLLPASRTIVALGALPGAFVAISSVLAKSGDAVYGVSIALTPLDLNIVAQICIVLNGQCQLIVSTEDKTLTGAKVAYLDSLGVALELDSTLSAAGHFSTLGEDGIADAFVATLKSDRPDGLFTTAVAAEHGQLLGVCYSNGESIRAALRRGEGVYWSRRRGLWHKGASSGNTQKLIRLEVDCDRDCVKAVVNQSGLGFCHHGTESCFASHSKGIAHLAHTLKERAVDAPAGSYTARLYSDVTLLRAKLLEEAGELGEAVADWSGDGGSAASQQHVVEETADVLYFALVALAKSGASLSDVEALLDARSLKVKRRKGDAKAHVLKSMGVSGTVTQSAGVAVASTPRTLLAAPASGTTAVTAVAQKPTTPYVPLSAEAEVARCIARRAEGKAALPRIEMAAILARGVNSTSVIDDQTKAIAAGIVNDVAAEGEAAVRRYAAKFGDIEALDSQLVLTKVDLEAAFHRIAKDQRELLQRTAKRVRFFAEAQRDSLNHQMEVAVCRGGVAGHSVAAMKVAGCYAPGGRYPLPSSVIMGAVPARVAGCELVIASSPHPSDVTLAAAFIAGVDHFLMVGGAHAIAAMAYGLSNTKTGEVLLPAADVVVGPGNRFVTAAKALVQSTGRVAIDMLAGPSEVLVIADGSADVCTVAADLIAQSEHDVLATAILITTDGNFAIAVEEELSAQLADLVEPNKGVAQESIKDNAFVCVVDSIQDAIAVSDFLAPEHLEVQMSTPAEAERVGRMCSHYGALFIGRNAAEVLGDYGAGPNHTLPTGGTARCASGLSVFTFLRWRTWLRMDDVSTPSAQEIVSDAVMLGQMEGLHGHAAAAANRLRDPRATSSSSLSPSSIGKTGVMVCSASPPFAPLPGLLSSVPDAPLADSPRPLADVSLLLEDFSDRLLFAIPKKGRLFKKCDAILKGAELDYTRLTRLDIALCDTVPIKFVFLPAHDIPQYVAAGEVDLGITGQDMVAEGGHGGVLKELRKLGFGKCKLCLLAKKTDVDAGITAADFIGKRIVTSFPRIATTYLDRIAVESGRPELASDTAGSSTAINFVSGSVEAAVGLGLADAVVDLVETGTTMRAAGLEIVSTILSTEAVLLSNPNTKKQALVDMIASRIDGYMTAKRYALISYNVKRDDLDFAVQITPGLSSPTVQPLAPIKGVKWCSVSAMVARKEVGVAMDKLKALGATGVIVFNLDNCRV